MVDFVFPTSSARTVLPVTTFSGKLETEATIASLLKRAHEASLELPTKGDK